MHMLAFEILLSILTARSQISVLGLTVRDGSGRAAAPGAGFSGQNLSIKYIPCVGTHLWITMPAKSTLSYAKSTLSYAKSTCVNRNK